MTSESPETARPNEETVKLFDTWLDAKNGPIALRLRQRLLPVEADDSGRGVIFPPTYADIGYNIDTLADGTRVATIDTVGSQANRLEPIFKSTGKDADGKELNSLASLVPQIEIVLHGKASAKKGKETEPDSGEADNHIEKRSILDLAHRSADAVVLASPTLAGEVVKAFKALRNKGDAAPLCTIAPTSLLFGVWDSRGSGEKRPRLVRSIIRAWDVEILHSAAQFNSLWKGLSDEQKEELDKAPKAKGVKLSTKGFADAPATFRKTKIPLYDREGIPNPEARVLGGVLAKGPIERDVTVNLVALRGLRGKDLSETMQVQKYVLSLALLAATADLELFLREGCMLRYAGDDVWSTVPRRGSPTPVSLPKDIETYATTAATPFKEKWPKDKDGKGLGLQHDFSLAEAKKLLVKKDEDAPASEQG